MKKNNILLSTSLLALSLPLLAACGSENYDAVLRVFNCEDYIYLNDEEEGYTKEDMVVQFEQYYEEETGKHIKVVYDTYDTNETMLNSLKTGKSHYDLVCASDYTLQKMVSLDMLMPFDIANKIPNYEAHCPEYLRGIFKGIHATNESGQDFVIDDYAVGYMWGTLGILYNPAFGTIYERLVDEDNDVEKVKDIVHEDMKHWSTLWNSKYKKTISIKDSMRDTYSVGVMKVFENELEQLRNDYLDGKLTSESYNSQLSEYFNKCDEDTVNKVQKELLELKKNIFGFEVDSGKEDINTGKIGINIAWSGDAVYSMDKGDSYGIELYYQIPETGGNIWFDGWGMPTGANSELAQEFLNFLSDPLHASDNMDYTGYTSFIGGDDILDLNRMWYDARAEYLYEYDDEADDWAVDENDEYVLTQEAVDNNWDWNSADLIQLVLDEGAEMVDLSYMFEGTAGLDKNGDPIVYAPEDMQFYTFEINRQFSTQYPSPEKIKSLAVMRDYGKDNARILDMWENVKTNSLPGWAMALFIAEIVLGLSFVLIFFITKKVRKNRRIARRNANA